MHALCLETSKAIQQPPGLNKIQHPAYDLNVTNDEIIAITDSVSEAPSTITSHESNKHIC